MKRKNFLRKRRPRNKIQNTPDVKNITSSKKEVVVKKEIIDYGYKATQKIISDVKEEIASDVLVKEEQTDFLDNVQPIYVNCHVGETTSDLVVTAKISPPMVGNSIKEMINSENKDKSKDIDVVIISDSSSDNMSIKQETQLSETQLTENQSE